ncbi:MAG: FAD synthase [Candidatus Thermoplasmatota archaeon]|nr:FAD synthase [Candidatus Thermoplasmatota archaeon]MCL5955767.1 FAD synthase [Candidatus Thermoplasmatota archaeon]
MIRVMATGVFDILHMGHIHYLSESKKLGDELLVVVARDSTAHRNGKNPLFDENSRLDLVKELKQVDRAILGHEGDIFRTVLENKPDIITLGYDQRFDAEKIQDKCRELGLDTKVVRISKYDGKRFQSSSEVRQKLYELIESQI